jgi:protocatechuate 3,4-dioxygenase beta subunit
MTSYSRRDFARSLGLAAGTLIASPTIAETEVSPSQTEGPFYPVHTQADKDADLTRVEGHDEEATGDRILVRGKVFNTKGQALPGATVDVWQANHFGRYDHPNDPNPAKLDEHFQGWAVLKTDADGSFGYKTIMPAPYPLGPGDNAPVRCRHIHYKVSHPEHTELTTQMYFEGDELIEKDIVMARFPKAQQALLIAAHSVDDDTGLPLYRFNVVLG